MKKNELKEAIVLVPVYRNSLEWFEKKSLLRGRKVLSKWKLVFISPMGCNISQEILQYGDGVERFPDHFFCGRDGYNSLMLSECFYKRFLDYKYVLIYQLDAFVFSDRLHEFCMMDYDYIGAPWSAPMGVRSFRQKRYRIRVGNGGFSLRKTKACLDLLADTRGLQKDWSDNEDSFFGYCGKYKIDGFKVAPIHIAGKFSIERPVKRLLEKNRGKLPFGCHAWNLFGQDSYRDIFLKYGVDLSVYVSRMQNLDEDDVQNLFYVFFRQRIRRKIGNLCSTLNMSDRDCSVYGFGKAGKEMVIQLFRYGFNVSRIYDCDKMNWGSMWHGIPICSVEQAKVDDNKIVIAVIDELFMPIESSTRIGWEECLSTKKALYREKQVIRSMQGNGFIYGRDFLGIGREYVRKLDWCGCVKYLGNRL